MIPETLQAGDTIVIISPAKKIEAHYVEHAAEVFTQWGYNVEVGPHCKGEHNYFSGTIAERSADLQWAINHPKAKAIVCARGGYGCIQILDLVNWDKFKAQPKWITGFSDVTVFHQFLAKENIASIHATMPLNFKENSQISLQSFQNAIEGIENDYEWDVNNSNVIGEVEGELIGGNLTVLCGLIGTKHQPDFKDKILFIEDVGEALYAIDRNLYQLKMAGILDQLKGIVVGDFSGIKDTLPAYNMRLEEIILAHFPNRELPIAFNFPAGHCDDNRAITFGENMLLSVRPNKSKLQKAIIS